MTLRSRQAAAAARTEPCTARAYIAQPPARLPASSLRPRPAQLPRRAGQYFGARAAARRFTPRAGVCTWHRAQKVWKPPAGARYVRTTRSPPCPLHSWEMLQSVVGLFCRSAQKSPKE